MANQNQDKDRILDKIKKCLNLSKSSEPAEAAAALRQAQKLMEMHNISEVELKLIDVGEADVKSRVSVSNVKDWEVRLVRTIADAFHCEIIWHPSRSWHRDVYGSYGLIGLKHQAQIAQYTADVMLRKLFKARGEFTRRLPAQMSREGKIFQADGFCHGWVDSVTKTIQKFAMPAETEELITEFKLVNYPDLKDKHSQKRDGSSFGRLAGRVAGEDESIHRPVNEEQLKRIGGPQ